VRFRKLPVEVEAIRWSGKNYADIKRWVALRHNEYSGEFDIPKDVHFFLKRRATGMTETLWQNIADDDWDSDITAAVYDYLHQTYVGLKDGQWVMCGTVGEFYPCADNGTGQAPLNYAPVTDPGDGDP
jgi:hypothetical protein